MDAIDPYYSSLSDHQWFYGTLNHGKKSVAQWIINASVFNSHGYWEKPTSLQLHSPASLSETPNYFSITPNI